MATAGLPTPPGPAPNRTSSRIGHRRGYKKYDTEDYSTRTLFLFQDCWLGPSRKRQRRQGRMRYELDDAPSIIVNSRKTLMVGDAKAVMEFYGRSFTEIQQDACKEVAKAFVKILCPKKRRTFPYAKGDAAAPDWWPDRVRHVEPDHLRKKGAYPGEV
ncbi:hypothetical protein CHGG_00186 [Chaetomium globosum CBS 148.51]|uniref:Subtelomeric hrmA-associated cluster protein AFUB-079030/YDR124W-like helical bundle domain-containing protein n=1 Tax=Chaetomium globosum (strain ATCC 6205 / CBS 148.51 / DSM 1962 / NBRC 6347 / NRRL 1970) TaxID=306901 RepID=Q2HHW8_CHAGB|nr:uncharacterized protein CHGG_00186 [Chaetomium globosum CBS 148.51]EAQ91951.1 hypothetical protein CHGG_00186 [Chaetomium globosum CBS 148.51]